MKAIIHRKYGVPSEVLSLQEVTKPEPKANEVLVKIHASSINSWDWDLVRGIPKIYRLMFGLIRPKNPIIGIDIAGTVESVGSEVRNFKPGGKVFGDLSNTGFGAFAAYACAKENQLASMPQNASFEQAACLPHGGVLALQSVYEMGNIKAGQDVLINGAGGCTGTIALQMAKNLGAKVTCVDTEEKRDYLVKLGADDFINYKVQDFTALNKNYDVIIELVSHKSLHDYNKVLHNEGKLIVVGGDVPKLLQVGLRGKIYGKNKNKKFGILGHKPSTENLIQLKSLFEEGVIKAQIDRTMILSEVPEAIQLLGEGIPKGKIAIKLN